MDSCNIIRKSRENGGQRLVVTQTLCAKHSSKVPRYLQVTSDYRALALFAGPWWQEPSRGWGSSSRGRRGQLTGIGTELIGRTCEFSEHHDDDSITGTMMPASRNFNLAYGLLPVRHKWNLNVVVLVESSSHLPRGRVTVSMIHDSSTTRTRSST